jgi:hypothetical protein
MGGLKSNYIFAGLLPTELLRNAACCENMRSELAPYWRNEIMNKEPAPGVLEIWENDAPDQSRGMSFRWAP